MVCGKCLGKLCLKPRRLITCLLVLLFAGASFVVLNLHNTRLYREDEMQEKLIEMQLNLQFLQSKYNVRHEEALNLQAMLENYNGTHYIATNRMKPPLAPEVVDFLKNITGSKTAQSVDPKPITQLKVPFIFQLMPYLMEKPDSLTPNFHMSSNRNFCDVVIGIPTVKRDKENYLMTTIKHLEKGMSDTDLKTTLIVVMFGETDMEFITKSAYEIEQKFPKLVKSGVIEVISPSPSYYPDFDKLPQTLGDSRKRVNWRTKQNLDTMYLMAYAQAKGTFYLMLEDDVIAKKFFMEDIRQFTAATTRVNPNWFFIEYCRVGGIGKLFRSSDLIHFLSYVQLFYTNMPIDWLLESYLADSTCGIDKTSKQCSEAKDKIRPHYKTSLFQHIGLYSSLKGKIQKVKDPKFAPEFFPHANPPLMEANTDIVVHQEYYLQKVYDGVNFFWGIKPLKDNYMEFWFKKPVIVYRYTFRTGNVEHYSDRIVDGVVEGLPNAHNANYTHIGEFDEFGMADGQVDADLGPLQAIRLRLTKDSSNWVVLSEVEIQTLDSKSS